MKEFTQKDGIQLLEAAGWNVVINGKTFGIYEDGKKLFGISNISLLSDQKYIVKHLIEVRAFGLGVEKGQEILKTNLKNLLDIK